MKKILALSLSSVLFIFPAYAADNAVTLTAGSGVTMRTKDIGAGVQSPFNILGDVTGTAIYGTAGSANSNVLSVQGIASGTAMPVTLTSTTITGTVAATQSGTWNITNISGTVSLPTGAATAAGLTTINTTLGTPFQAGGSIGNTTFAATQATSSNLKAQVDPLTAASWGIGTSTQNSASATNGQLALGQFNTTPTTITTGNMSPLQMDNAGNLLVNIKTGASSGAVAQGSTTSGQTGGLTQGAVTTSAPTYTNATTNPLSMDTAGNIRVVLPASQLGTLGQTTMSGSVPQTIASDQAVSTANASVAINVSTATTTQLVALSSGKKIYVTAWDATAAGTGNFKLVYGTGSSCGTGTTDLTGNYNWTAQAGIAKGAGIAAVLIVPASNALCAVTSAAVQMSGSVTYQQF